mgnify:CR=1 FL=1
MTTLTISTVDGSGQVETLTDRTAIEARLQAIDMVSGGKCLWLKD